MLEGLTEADSLVGGSSSLLGKRPESCGGGSRDGEGSAPCFVSTSKHVLICLRAIKTTFLFLLSYSLKNP